MVDVDPGCAVAACISTADGAGGANPVGEGEAEAEGEGKIQDDEAEAEMGGCGEGGEGDGVPPNSGPVTVPPPLPRFTWFRFGPISVTL